VRAQVFFQKLRHGRVVVVCEQNDRRPGGEQARVARRRQAQILGIAAPDQRIARRVALQKYVRAVLDASSTTITS
jgi:hypothetical protein